MGKPGVAGVHTNQRLSLSTTWEGPRKIGQGFKPDSGNLTVRDYRGASGNVSHGGTVIPSCNRKSGNGTPPPTAGRARFLSQSRPSGLMSGDGKRSDANRPQATAPIVDSTTAVSLWSCKDFLLLGVLLPRRRGSRHGER